MMKQVYAMIAVAMAMTACSEDAATEGTSAENRQREIRFGGGTQTVTRAVGTEAAKALGGNFHLLGTKTVGGTESTVFGQTSATSDVADEQTYHFWYTYNSASTTTTNSSGWEYVGEKNYDYVPTWGETTGSGAEDNSLHEYGSTTAKHLELPATQTIKYWDWSASKYDFMAYSFADGVYSTKKWKDPYDASATLVDVGLVDGNVSSSSVKITGVPSALDSFFVAKATVVPADYGKVVALNFQRVLARVRVGMYETIPGYYVSKVKSRNGKAVMAGSFIGSINMAITATVKIDANSKVSTSYDTSDGDYKRNEYDIGYIQGVTAPEGITVPEAMIYMGTSASAPSWAHEDKYSDANHYEEVWPNTTDVDDMTLTLSYTLHSEDTNETIEIEDATCTVPAEFMKWEAGHAYTYLFKLTDSELTPITFDGLVIENPDGSQETVTTVSTPSVTTYSQGSDVTQNQEYKAREEIYITVSGMETMAVGTAAGQSQMYQLTFSNDKTSATPAEIASVLNGTTVSGLTLSDGLLSDDNKVSSVPGVGNFSAIKYTPTTAGTYAFAYMIKAKEGDTAAEYAIKIINVVE